MGKAQAPGSGSKPPTARQKRAEIAKAKEQRLAQRAEDRYQRQERARQNRLERERRSKAYQIRKVIYNAKLEARASRKRINSMEPFKLVEMLEPLVESARLRMESLEGDVALARSVAAEDDPESVAAFNLVRANAQEARRSYHSLRVSLIYRKKKLAMEFKPNPDEAEIRQKLWDSVKNQGDL